jgi:hypothetical protein
MKTLAEITQGTPLEYTLAAVLFAGFVLAFAARRDW